MKQEVVRVLSTPADLQGLISNSSSSSAIIDGEGKGEGRISTAYMNSRSQSKSSSSRTTLMEGGEGRRPAEDGREGRILTSTSKIKRGSSSPRPISTTTTTPTTSTIRGKERGDGSSAGPISTAPTPSTTSTIEGKERGEGSSARPIRTIPTPSTTSSIEGKERGEERIPTTTTTTTGCDVVVVDAPCSSTGVLRRRPSLRWTLDPNQAQTHLPNLQKALLAQAQAHVRVGGRLIYATCSALAQENEEVARWFMGEFGDRFRPLGWEEGGGESEERLLKAAEKCRERGLGIDDQAGWLRLLPHIHGTDGFFIARWIRER